MSRTNTIDFNLLPGDDFSRTLIFTAEDEEHDVSAWEFSGEVTDPATGAEITTFDVDMASAATGSVRISLTDEQSAEFEGRYVDFVVRLVTDQDFTRTFLKGRFNLTQVDLQPTASTLTFDVGDSTIELNIADSIVAGGVPTSRTITAGAGLTGGGDLSANRTFAVGANPDGSIVVAADSVGVGVLASDAQHGDRGGGSLHANAVAGGAAGFLSGADKTKLDGIEAGADVTDATNVTAAGAVMSGSAEAIAYRQLQDMQYFGDYSDGDLSPSSGTVTLARDMFYRDLTPSGTAKFILNGYSIRCRTLDLSNAPADCFTHAATGNGNNGSSSTGGSGASTVTQSGFWGTGATGNAGGNQSAAGTTQNVGSNYTALGGIGGASGANDSGTAGSAGGTRINTATETRIGLPPFWPLYGVGGGLTMPSAVFGGTGGAGGRQGAGGGLGGGGGGGAQSGATIAIFARTIIRGASTAAGCIKSLGGNGGNGAAGTTSTNQGGGGGGGGGGAGGLVLVTYRTLSGSSAANALRSVGGAGGNGGNGGGASAIGGTGGEGGQGGAIYVVDLSAGTITKSGPTSGSAATVASTQSGTAGGAGGTTSVDL